MNRQEELQAIAVKLQNLEKELNSYTRQNLTTAEYTAVVEIREACNRIIEVEML